MKTNSSFADQQGRFWRNSQRPLAFYPIAIVLSILALWPSLVVPDAHTSPVFLFFYLAVLISAWVGGLGPGILAVVLTFLESWFFVVPRVNSLEISEVGDLVRLLSYVPTALVTGTIVARLRHLRSCTDALLAAERSARRATAKAERRNSSLLESVGDAFYSLDSEWCFTYVNRHAEQLLRKSRETLVGRCMWDEFPEARGTIFEQTYRRVAETRNPQSFETFYASLGFWAEVRTFAKDDGGISVFFRDVTERHRLLAELAKNASRFEATFELAAVGIAHVGPDGRWLRVNQRLCEIVGYSRPEMLARTFQDITHPDDLEKDVELYERLKAGKIDRYTIEKRYLHKNGAVVWGNLTVSPMREPGGEQFAISVIEDISERKAAEERLLGLSAIVESSEDAIFGKTLQGVINTWNNGATRMYGYSAAEIVGRPVSMLIPPDLPDEMPNVLSRVAMGEHVGYETVRRRKDGSLIDVSLNISPIRDGTGRIVGASTIARNITAIKRRTSELESLMNNAPVGLAFFDREHRYLRINPALAEINGIPADAHLGRTIKELLPENAAKLEPILDKVFKTRRAVESEITGQTPKEPGVTRTWIAGFYPIVAGGENPFAVGVYVVEITDRKQVEEKLRESEERLKTVIENLAEGLVVVDIHANVLHWNRTALQMHGYSKQYDELAFLNSLTGTFELATLDGHVIPFEEWPVRRLVRGEHVRDYELMVRNKTEGWERIFSYGGVLVSASPDHPAIAMLTIRDVTERRQAQRALRESEERLARTQDLALVMALHVGLEGQWLRVPPRFCEFLGYTNEELVGMPFKKVTHPDDFWADWSQCLRLISGEISSYEMEKRFIRKDGSVVWGYINCSVVKDAQGKPVHFLTYVRDITEQKGTEQALRESEERLRALADNMSQFAWMADETGWIFWYNKRWFDYTGTTLEEMEGQGWQKVHHPDHVQRVVDKISRCFRTGEIWEDTFPLCGKDGQYRWFLSRAIPIRNESGKVLRWFGTNTDITDQMSAEESLRQREQQLVEANRRAETSLAQLRTTIDSMTEGVYVCDENGGPLLFNPAFLRIYDFLPDASLEDVRNLGSLVEINDTEGQPVPLPNGRLCRYSKARASDN